VHGWGAFAREPIQKNDLVTEYVGEVSILCKLSKSYISLAYFSRRS
jgi:hypothetical protein